jgi:hypothetical protein
MTCASILRLFNALEEKRVLGVPYVFPPRVWTDLNLILLE